ncbi:MAG TPA: hypothetical protein VHM02_14495 [Thermoanaerobaculia bacterium]|nr:hypothetical protein [Thermoanaerobaculia bacterium]
MRESNVERLERLLDEHRRRRDDGSARPETRAQLDPEFREAFSHAVREQVLPILEEAVATLRPRVEKAHLFHQLGTAGLKLKLDQWDDYERALVFFGDVRSGKVRITHEGVGFSLLAREMAVEELTLEVAAAEVMRFADRLLREPALPPRRERRAA